MANRKEREENPGRLSSMQSFETGEFVECSRAKVDLIVLPLLFNVNEAWSEFNQESSIC